MVTAIPVIGARPGDELVVRPADPDFPVTILRTFDLEMLPAIPDAAVKMLGAEPAGTSEPLAVGPGLRVVR